MNFLEQRELQQVDEFLQNWVAECSVPTVGEKRLLESLQYSLMSGGKRFRPVLSLWVAEALGHSGKDTVLSFACDEVSISEDFFREDIDCCKVMNMAFASSTFNFAFSEF